MLHLAFLFFSPVLLPQSGPTVTIDPREIAVLGTGGPAVRETDVSVSGGQPMVACVSSPFRAAVRTGSGSWTELSILGGAGLDDPTIEPGATSGSHVVVARNAGAIRFSRYPLGPRCPQDLCMASMTLPGGPSGVTNDKPWLIRGGSPEEYYTFYWHDPNGVKKVAFVHTKDAFASQAGGSGSGLHVTGFETFFNAQPVRAADGTIYVARRLGSDLRFLGVRKNVDDTHTIWELNLAGGPLALPIRHIASAVNEFAFPVPCYDPELPQITVRFMPRLLADPTDPNRVLVVYHDLAEGSTTDVDVYCAELYRSVPSQVPYVEEWAVSTPVRVDDAPVLAGDEHVDSFLPVAEFDSLGRVHVGYYDNRPDSCAGGSPGNDHAMRYTISLDAGGTFAPSTRLTDCAQPVDLDFDMLAPPAGPREYNGIALDESSSIETVVWMSYMGTSTAVPVQTPGNRAVIYASRIAVSIP